MMHRRTGRENQEEISISCFLVPILFCHIYKTEQPYVTEGARVNYSKSQPGKQKAISPVQGILQRLIPQYHKHANTKPVLKYYAEKLKKGTRSLVAHLLFCSYWKLVQHPHLLCCVMFQRGSEAAAP